MLWHVHAANGECYAIAVNYEVAYKLCLTFYNASDKKITFFATLADKATLNKRPLPNS